MAHTLAILTFDTDGSGLYDISDTINRWVRETEVRVGLLTLFCQHTSASLLINENAAPAVRRDLQRWLASAAPAGDGYEHDDEGPDDMPAHIKAMLTGNSLSIPVAGARMMLGTWQGLFLAEHREQPHKRTVVAHLTGN
ncbi:MAG: secondary thiamine-phosphate synthase enzyme YjbQ [Croceibacterium sp.]